MTTPSTPAATAGKTGDPQSATSVEVHAEYVAEMVRQQVYAQYGELTYTTGLSVTTTLRAAEQQAAYTALRRTLIEHELRQAWRGPEGVETLAADLADTDPAIAAGPVGLRRR